MTGQQARLGEYVKDLWREVFTDVDGEHGGETAGAIATGAAAGAELAIDYDCSAPIAGVIRNAPAMYNALRHAVASGDMEFARAAIKAAEENK